MILHAAASALILHAAEVAAAPGGLGRVGIQTTRATGSGGGCRAIVAAKVLIWSRTIGSCVALLPCRIAAVTPHLRVHLRGWPPLRQQFHQLLLHQTWLLLSQQRQRCLDVLIVDLQALRHLAWRARLPPRRLQHGRRQLRRVQLHCKLLGAAFSDALDVRHASWQLRLHGALTSWAVDLEPSELRSSAGSAGGATGSPHAGVEPAFILLYRCCA